jgi:hypothetical protein
MREQGEFVVVQKLTGAHSKEIVSLESIRPQSRRQPLKPANFKAKSFVVPEDLRHESVRIIITSFVVFNH